MALAEAIKEHSDFFKHNKHIIQTFPKEKGDASSFGERVGILHDSIEGLIERSKDTPLRMVGIKNSEIPIRIRQVFQFASGSGDIVGAGGLLYIDYNHPKPEYHMGFVHQFNIISLDNTKLQDLRIHLGEDLFKLIQSHEEEKPDWYTERYRISPWQWYASGENYLESARSGLLDVLLLNPEYKGFQLELLEELVSVFNTPFFIPRPAPKT